MKHTQVTIAEQIASDTRPIEEWVTRLERLAAILYEHDSELSRRAENLVRSLAATAADLDCIGTDDRSAPAVGASARDVLAYVFRRWPEEGVEFKRLISRADQLLGRERLLTVSDCMSVAAASGRR